MEKSERVVCLLLSQKSSEKDLNALAEACGRFSPRIAIRPKQAVFIEISRTKNLYSEESLQKRFFALARKFTPSDSSPLQMGWGDNAAAALAFARYSKETNWEMLPIEAIRDYADPFQMEFKLDEFKLEQMIRLLKSLGLKTLGDFCQLPLPDLVSRFGRQALEVRGRMLGEIPMAWPGFYPEPKIFETLSLLESCGEDWEALSFILKGLVDRVMMRLRGRCERAIAIQLIFELEKTSVSSTRKWTLHFPTPQGSTQAVMPILRERLMHDLLKEGLTAPLESVSLEVLEVVPGRGAQRDFFCHKEEEFEALDRLVARMDEKLGSGSAFLAVSVPRYLPEKAYEKYQDSSKKVFGKKNSFREFDSLVPSRPTRLLKNPEKVIIRGNWIFRENGTQWKMSQWCGPERLSGEWWSDYFQRDYFQVLIEGGGLVWIFRDTLQSYYLHGFFD